MGLVQKSFSDIITFSRSSNATRVGPTGVLEYAPHNLALQSQTFDNASWSKLDATVTSNAIAAPDGTVTADKLIATTAVSTSHAVYQGAGSISANWTFSIYAKAGEYNRLGLAFSNTGYVFFNLTTGVQEGTVGLYITSYSITSVGNGWYRISFGSTVTASGTNIAVYLFNSTYTSGDPNFTGDGTSGVYIWGAQLSVGPYALDYTPTTSAAVYGPRFDYDGSGVTIVEPVSRNLLTYSEQFDNAGWTKSNASITANAIAAPDGTVTADKLVENTSNNFHYAYQGTSTATGTYTYSIFLKSAGRSFAWIYAYTNVSATAYFDLANGTVGTVSGSYSPTATITSVGNGWYRCTMTFAATDVNFACGVGAATANGTSSYTGDGTSGIYAWGAQLEVGSTATAYMVSGATNGFRAVPVVSGSATARGLLVEEQRTNLALYSEDLSNAAWTKTRSSITANAIAAPDGTVTADKLVEDTTASNTHFIIQNISLGGSVDSSPYVFSIFAKAGERTRLEMFDNNSNVSGLTIFDLSAGTVVNGTGKISSAGNGWYRCSIYPLKDFTTSSSVYILLDNGSTDTYTGNGTSGLYLWGAQLEANASFATSYIPTPTNSTVTRSADVASVNTLSPWFNATEGTLFAEFNAYTGVSYCAPTSLYTDANNEITIVGGTTGGGATGFVVIAGGSVQANFGTRALSQKIAGAYKLNDFAVSTNGAAAATDTSGTVPSISTLGLGSAYSSSYLNGHLRRVAYYPRRLTNAELQALTA